MCESPNISRWVVRVQAIFEMGGESPNISRWVVRVHFSPVTILTIPLVLSNKIREKRVAVRNVKCSLIYHHKDNDVAEVEEHENGNTVFISICAREIVVNRPKSPSSVIICYPLVSSLSIALSDEEQDRCKPFSR